MKLMVLDGNSVINRAYYGVRALTTKDGFFTNAIYGFLNILEKLRTEEQPDALCVTFDLKAPTFRHLAYDGYKATRHPMPDELAMQLPMMKDILRAMRIPIFECEGWEADDVIGTLSQKGVEAGYEVFMVTPDKDYGQLVRDNCKIYKQKGAEGSIEIVDREAIRGKYGIDDPSLVRDILALWGDASDNIPGVPGIGEKTAMALVQEYGSIDTLYAQMPDVHAKPAALRKLQEGEESARHSYWLATIVTDAPLEFRPEDNLRQPFKPELYDLFLRLEFQKLIDKYGLSPQHQPEEKADAAAEVKIGRAHV